MHRDRTEDAERYFQAAFEKAPNEWFRVFGFAWNYERKRDIDRWAKILGDYVEHADLDLVDPMLWKGMQYKLVRYFSERKEWKKALRSIRDRSIQGSQSLTARCYEGLQDWKEAEKVYQDAGGLHWFMFCRRTGEGDLESSRDAARARIENLDPEYRANQRYELMTYYLLEDQPEKALVEIEDSLAASFNAPKDRISLIPIPVKALWKVLIADRLKDAEKRDEALNLIINYKENRQVPQYGPSERVPPKNNPSGTAAVAKLILDDLAQGGQGRIDLDAAEHLAGSIQDPEERFMFRFLLSQYLNQRGQTEAADRLAKLCMAWWVMEDPFRTLAGAMLLEHDIWPEDYKELFMPDSKVETTAPASPKPTTDSRD